MSRLLRRALVWLLALFVLLVAVLHLSNPPLPDTAEMRAYFAERTAAFERHHARTRAALAAGGVDRGRNDEVGYAFLLPVRGGVIYITHTRGIGVGMSGTGVARLESAPEPRYPDLESMLADARAVEGFTGYAPAGDGWYLVLWEAD